MKKKLILFSITLLVFILVGYFYITNNNKDIQDKTKNDDLLNKEVEVTAPPSKEIISSNIEKTKKSSNNSSQSILKKEDFNNNLKDKPREEFHQDEMPAHLLQKMKEDLGGDKFKEGLAPDFSKEGMEKLKNNNIKDTISIDDLPAPIANDVRKKLDFRKKNGYDEVSDRKAQDVLSVVGRINGAEIPTPNLSFNLSLLPSILNSKYQYLGYIYPYQSEKAVLYDSVKRVFGHVNNNSILVIDETSLKNGSATLTTEFVNTKVLNCPAVITQKKSSNNGEYAQINWNTRNIGYTVYQFNLSKNTNGLVELANIIATVNKNIHNCNNLSESQKDLTPATVEAPDESEK